MIGGGRKFVPEGQPPGRVDFTVRLDRETASQLGATAKRLRITHQQAIVDAVRLWLRQTGGKP